ncbi:MAG: hypothetical protein NZ480_04260 [Bdellovibrionaceae bacterium]|nr:hypothetical protein [Pseudobdellovibrionaceae bacterium]MDW8190186.1 hypothetical protein [Pseudobdellovibrionaceae bacterium]
MFCGFFSLSCFKRLYQGLLVVGFILFWGEMAQAINVDPRHPLVGSWHFESYILDGVELPKPNPNLKIEFHFYTDGVSRLYWYRTNEKGFCDRYAYYNTTDTDIHELIFWVNPQNRSDCAKDPDMQVGRESVTPYRIDAQGRLLTRVYVGQWDVWYVWVKQHYGE